jgi:predicted PurR-regulated permease PerM
MSTLKHLPEERPDATVVSPTARFTATEIAAWVIIASALLFFFMQHLIVGLLAGLLLYRILDSISGVLSKRMSERAARPLSLLSATLVTSALLVGAVALLVSVIRKQSSNIPALMTRMAEILESTRLWLAGLGNVSIIPDAIRDAEDFKLLVVTWLKSHAEVLKVAGGSFGIAMAHIIMGLLVGVLVFFRHVSKGAGAEPERPLAAHLSGKVQRFSDTFGQIIAAQVKISAVNTALTALYLLVLVPLFSKPLPFAPTIVLITFLCGLLPVVGNLISNAVIVVISLGISLTLAIASLVFLVVIHKLEYIVNSRIVGSKTSSQAWEILLAIIVGEAAFGVPGVVMAPIVYAFVKGELKEKELV